MNTDTFDYASMTDSLRLIGYQIGFLFEIIRKTGVSLSQDDVPTDDGSYRFFVNGMSGSLFDRGQSETGISLADASLIDYHEDERIHDVGLKIYLAVKLGNTNGAGEIVDDPETLRVFKLYASGRTDNTYENTWSKINIRTTPLSDEMQHGLIARELGMQAYKANQTR